MTAIEIITVAQAKEWLSAPDETNLKRLIESSINFVEEYTGHTLVRTTKTVQLPFNGYGIRFFPMTITAVKDSKDNTVPYQTKTGVYNTYVFAPTGSYVTVTTGYDTVEDIPGMLVEVAYKMLTYLYENRDIYTASLPQDFQVMINKSRRNLV